MSSCAIEIENLVKRFGPHTILDDLNVKIPQGKITTILGFSGAGKSTLLKHILGLYTPDQGSVVVLGSDLGQLSELELREFRQKFGMLFQYAALFDSFTAEENVFFPLQEFTKLGIEEIRQRARNMLLTVGITEDSFEKFPSQLSGGMRKRVGLARALVLGPDVMLYDEPTTGLDPITTKMVNRLILDTAEKYKDRLMTSVIISHDIKATLEISDFIAFLDHGRIIEYLPVDQFKETTNPLVRSFLDI
ncbi:MAG: ATP-binding cassette domain-containing protein [Bdellovibrionales bacterium]|nr:ATP-binding cassette domain-containing protein [Bdellovibrionales bacterium]MBT3526469.1 ATP-binding cassette domain-containing protein [Bdellovibrionales bacterium]MBT7669366.1 ATP-binding cassette domain-containing protein [Bdellovibrionales bacterium]